MAVIGNSVTSVAFITDTFSGNSGTTTFSLSRAPATTSSIAVFIGGAYQAPSLYTLNGQQIIFLTPPTTGTNNLVVLHLGVGATTTLPAGGSVSLATLAAETLNYIGSGSTYANSAFATANTVTSASSYANSAFAAANSAAVSITNDDSSNVTYYPLLSVANTGSINKANTSSSKLTYNPSSGTLTSTIVTSSSDAALKYDINTYENALDVIKSLRGVSFKWKDNNQKNVGLVAQEVEEILPEVVISSSGLKSINYSSIVGVLVEAIKEQQAQIEELKNINKI
jgi:hypothetical protein